MVDICTLPSRAILRLTGSDASTWLQGLVTSDVEDLGQDRALYTALLSPQGKLLFDFFLYRAADDILIDCEAISADALTKRLLMYRLRSDVALKREPGLGVISSCTPLDTSLAHVELAIRDPRLEKLGYRMVGNLDRMAQEYTAQGHGVDDEQVYRDYLLELGIPNGQADFAPGKAYPLESNFDELGGISFTKGCFVGQEVSARMKHKAVLKKRTLPVTGSQVLPGAGTVIHAGGAKVGEILSTSGEMGLALVRLEEWKKAVSTDSPLEADGIRLNVSVPGWLEGYENV